MTTMKRALATLTCVLTIGAASTALDKSAVADARCHHLHGKAGIKANVVSVSQGCTSAVGLCTAGVFEGDHLLRGTTSFVADGVVPAAGMPAVEAQTTLSYSGLLTITTDDGTLTTRDTGIFDTAAGLFASRDIVVGGTGKFAGATGHLLFTGTGTTTFDSVASGEICLAE